MSKKLLFVVHKSSYFVSHRLQLAECALKNGYEVHVAAASDHTTKKILENNIIFHAIPFTGRGMNIFKEFKCILALARLFKKLKPDLIHQLTIKPILYGTFAARICGFNKIINAIAGLGYVFVEKEGQFSILRKSVTLAYRLVLGTSRQYMIFQNPDDQFFFISQKMAQKERTIVIPGSGVNPDKFPITATQKPSPPIVLFASRMIWDKGVKEFVDAAEILFNKGFLALYLLVGAPDPANPQSVPESYLENLNKTQYIKWLGYQVDMQKYFSLASLFCLPSYYREGIPKVLLEAAASGLPIVTSNMPGCKESVIHNFNGLLIEPQNSQALACAIEKILNNPQWAHSLGENGRSMVLKHFSEDIVIGATLKLYKHILNNT